MKITGALPGNRSTSSTVLLGAQLLRRIENKIRTPLPLFRILNRNEQRFECPICGYEGPFANFRSFAGFRRYAICPQCDGLERHRLQYLVVMDALSVLSGQELKMLHFAPEKSFKQMFSRRFTKYETADLFMEGVDHKVDMQDLPFEDGSYDFVFASHVLEHIQDDRKAIKEIRRVLRPNGIAVLPVPIVCDKTIEYPEANQFEAGHVRAPGLDYFERYKEYFGRVEVHGSNSFPQKYQIFVYEDRSKWPIPECPLRPPMQGTKHSDFVPVCYA
jgi:SAM-dependent methyltransferase